ncbi:unnamed protein product [Prorocentrum cordatum]|uniref:Gamma-glutamylcyclotransferase n=1 Tax=Prorocentrum cordatum TaxID=2364126 RepID=A0ABN9Q341_9DINO|nr:unnamed protein product [Polarella glacialis]
MTLKSRPNGQQQSSVDRGVDRAGYGLRDSIADNLREDLGEVFTACPVCSPAGCPEMLSAAAVHSPSRAPLRQEAPQPGRGDRERGRSRAFPARGLSFLEPAGVGIRGGMSEDRAHRAVPAGGALTAANVVASSSRGPPGAASGGITVVGFGSLLSERSARGTFPDLAGFRLARVRGHRRVFRHPAGIFFERGIVPKDTLEFSSLSVEPCEGSSIVVAVMDIPDMDMDALAKREEEYDLVETPFEHVDSAEPAGSGLMCLPAVGDVDAFVEKWGAARFQESYGQWGIKTIWGWGPDSGILPCPVYLRHCVLAAQKAGTAALESFLDDTFLADRTTTIRAYLASRPDIMETLPPPSLLERYNG